jgi:hypothetical protein
MLRGGVLRTVVIAPFEVGFATLAIYRGIAGLFGYSVIADAFLELPGWLSLVTNILFAVSGLAIVWGLYRVRREMEVVGLILLGFSLVIRSTVVATAADGGDPAAVIIYVETMVLSMSLFIRLWVLFTRRSLLLGEPSRSSDQGDVIITGRV